MMGTHVRFVDAKGHMHVELPGLLSIDGHMVTVCHPQLVPLSVVVTPEERDRLAALLTGEGEVKPSRVDFPCDWCGKELRGYDAKTKDGAPFLTLCSDGEESCSGRFDRTYFAGLHRAYDDIKKHRDPAPSDPRTPGQVAHEAYWSTYGNDGDDLPTWSEVGGKGRGSWEKAAAAVLAHGRER